MHSFAGSLIVLQAKSNRGHNNGLQGTTALWVRLISSLKSYVDIRTNTETVFKDVLSMVGMSFSSCDSTPQVELYCPICMDVFFTCKVLGFDQ